MRSTAVGLLPIELEARRQRAAARGQPLQGFVAPTLCIGIGFGEGAFHDIDDNLVAFLKLEPLDQQPW